MAERRMFAKTIIDSDAFLDMPATAQLLYFQLGVRADDDGFVNNPKRIMRDVRSSDDDMKMLVAKQYVIPFDSGVIVITHWHIHNYIRKDRYIPTTCTEEKKELNLGSDGIYKLYDTHLVDQRSTNGIPSGSIGKVRLGKDSIDKNKEKKKSYLIDSYSKNEDLISSLKDFIEMRKKIKAPMTERAVNLMLSKLSSMTDDDTEKIKIINQSIMYSWKGIFPVRGMLPVKEEKRHDRFPARDDGEESVDWGAFDGA